MSLNPIVALSEQFQKLINEHGSAAILRDHLALFRDQVLMLEKENLRLINENGVSKVSEEKLKSDIEHLQKENDKLRSKIQESEKPTEQPAHKTPLEDVSIKILAYIAKNEKVSDGDISSDLKIEAETAKFYIYELNKQKMVQQCMGRRRNGLAFSAWALAQEGRRFLVENKMLT